MKPRFQTHGSRPAAVLLLTAFVVFPVAAFASSLDPNPMSGMTSPPQLPCQQGVNPSNADTLCSDLYRFTCAPGEYDDGTGVAATAGAIDTKVAQVKQKATAAFTEEFGAALKSQEPQNAYFRKVAMSALGLTGSPVCEDDPKCDTYIQKGLVGLAMKRTFPPQKETPIFGGGGYGGLSLGNSDPSLVDIDALINNPIYQDVEKNTAARARKQVQDPQATKKVESEVFPDVLKLIKQLVSESIEDPKVRDNILLKVGAIRYEGTDCSEMTSDSKGPSISSALVPNAFYDPKRNIFKYCNGLLLGNQSEFQIAGVIAHELGHSFDPCRIAMGSSDLGLKYTDPTDTAKCEAEFPFKGVLSCLRSAKSVGARKIGTMSGVYFDSAAPKGKPSGDDDGSCPDCGSSGQSGTQPASPGAKVPSTPIPDATRPMSKDKAFCSNDQITESFADWVSAEVLPRYMAQKHPNLNRNQSRVGYSNVFRGTCDNSDPTPTFHLMEDIHPDMKQRVNKIFLMSPAIRKQMGCPENTDQDAEYCPVKKGGAP